MSPRAAWRLEQAGFMSADFAGGKSDWLAHGLPYEGEADLVGRHLTEAVTCQSTETVAAVRERVGDASVLVLDGDTMVGAAHLAHVHDHGLDQPVTRLLDPSVVTVRPSEPCEQVAERMAKAGVDELVVTDPAARLLGLFLLPR